MATSELGVPLLEKGLAYLKSQADVPNVRAVITDGWTFGSSYADIVGALSVAIEDIAGTIVGCPQGDGATPAGREITIAPISFASASRDAAGTDLHVCLVSREGGLDEVFAVNDVSNDQGISEDNPINVASYKIGISQAPQS